MDTGPRRVRLLAVCGSLQQESANRIVLDAAISAAGDETVDDFDRLAEIPPFDPDRIPGDGPAVDDWRRRVGAADAVVIAVPEYAGGMSGVLKNALDWLVGSGELYRKPVAVLSAATSGGQHARATTTRTLTWQGAHVIEELGIAGPRTKIDQGRVTDVATRAAIDSVMTTLLGSSAMSPEERRAQAVTVAGRFGIDAVHVA